MADLADGSYVGSFFAAGCMMYQCEREGIFCFFVEKTSKMYCILRFCCIFAHGLGEKSQVIDALAFISRLLKRPQKSVLE